MAFLLLSINRGGEVQMGNVARRCDQGSLVVINCTNKSAPRRLTSKLPRRVDASPVQHSDQLLSLFQHIYDLHVIKCYFVI